MSVSKNGNRLNKEYDIENAWKITISRWFLTILLVAWQVYLFETIKRYMLGITIFLNILFRYTMLNVDQIMKIPLYILN